MNVPNPTRARKYRRVIASLLLLSSFLISVTLAVGFVQQERTKNTHNHALIIAIRTYDAPRVNSLLEAGADANASATPPETQSSWQIIRKLFARQQVPPHGPNALLISTEPLLVDPDSHEDLNIPRPEQLTIMEALLKHGANVNYRDNADNTALNYAAAWMDDREIDLLIAHGADVNNVNGIGETPLMEAAADGNAAGVRSLLNHHALVNRQSKSGYTALIYAAQGPDVTDSIVKDLLDHQADFRLKDMLGFTAITYAMRAGARVKIGLLRQAGAK